MLNGFKYSVPTLFIYLGFYLIASFVETSFDPNVWDPASKGFVAFLWTMTLIFSVIMFLVGTTRD